MRIRNLEHAVRWLRSNGYDVPDTAINGLVDVTFPGRFYAWMDATNIIKMARYLARQ